MHLQFFHVDYCSMVSTKRSTRPKGIINVISENAKSEYHNSIVIFTTIESSDTKETIMKGFIEIEKVYSILTSESSLKVVDILIVPYSHLNNVQTDYKISYSLIEYLYKILKEKLLKPSVYLGDFGYSTKWKMSVKSHRLSTLYRHIN